MEKKSEIAVFSFAFTPFEGGAEIAAREIMRRLKVFNFTVFTNKFDRQWLSREQEGNLETIRVGRGIRSSRASQLADTGQKSSTRQYYGRFWDKILYIFQAWREAEKLHARKRFRVIWAVMASYGGIAALFFKLNHPTIPLLLTVQEGDSERHLAFGKLGLVGILSQQIIKKADYIQVISNYLKKFVEKRGAGAAIEVIPNGVDLDLFSVRYANAELKAIRENLGISDEYVVITTSRLAHKNGLDFLIQAIAECQKFLDVKCLIIGDGPERRVLRDLAAKLKIESGILFLGQIPQKDLPLYFRISDVFVRASRSEGLGSSFLEAMAVGVPVIGTPVGGIVDFLKDGQTGFLVKPEDPADLAAKIKYVLISPEIRKKTVENAFELVNRNYSWDTIAKSFLNIFDKLISHPTKTGNS